MASLEITVIFVRYCPIPVSSSTDDFPECLHALSVEEVVAVVVVPPVVVVHQGDASLDQDDPVPDEEAQDVVPSFAVDSRAFHQVAEVLPLEVAVAAAVERLPKEAFLDLVPVALRVASVATAAVVLHHWAVAEVELCFPSVSACGTLRHRACSSRSLPAGK